MIWDYLRLIYRDVVGRKFSSFLTFFAISLGIVSIFVIFLVSAGFEQSISKEFEKLGTNRLIISFDGSQVPSLNFKKGLTDDEARLVENKAYIEKVFSYYIKNLQLKYSNEFVSRSVFGGYLDEEFFTDFNAEVEYGRYPKSNEKYVVVIGPEFAENMYSKPVGVGSNIYIKDVKFKVVGVLKSIGNPEDDKNFYVPIDTLRDIYDDPNTVHMLYATVVENYDVDVAASNIDILLENRFGDDTVDVMTLASMIEQLNSVLDIIKLTLGGIAFVSLIVGALGIINTMFVIITEKTKDIGIMKAVGARNIDVFMIYVLEAGLFGFLGGVLGIVFGSFGGKAFEAWAVGAGYTFLEINISFTLVGILLLFSFCVGAFAGFVPAYKASRLKIVDTFRK